MIDPNYRLFKGIEGLRCQECDTFIWSRSHHDFRPCPCGTCFVDGGRDYFRAGWEPDKKLPSNETYDILIDLRDWSETLLPVTKEDHDRCY